MHAQHPVRIAFLDTGNTGRSVAAEALAKAAIAQHRLNAQAISRAAHWNPYNIHPEENFVLLFRERGIDLSRHRAAPFGAPEAAFSDLILTMTEAHKAWAIAHFPDATEKIFTLAKYAVGTHREVLDAFGQTMDFYIGILAELDGLVEAAVLKAANA